MSNRRSPRKALNHAPHASADVRRSGAREGRGHARGRRHPYWPLLIPWVADGEWKHHAGHERGRRWSSLLWNVRYVLVLVLLSAFAAFLWRTDVRGCQIASVVLAFVVAFGVLTP
jgi:hypothetical protein